MKNISIILLLIASLSCHAQELSAKVVDENDQPLTGATVYFDGTTSGVITNLYGVFNIKTPENITEPILVITFLGYESIYEKNIQNLKDVYKLRPRAENLDVVNLYTSPFSREDMLKVFKKNFLGQGKPARQCQILNLDDVIVYYNVKNNTLYASAYNPIIVQNDYLGYKIRFDLSAFEVKFNAESLEEKYLKQSFYAGYSFFEDTNPGKQKRRQNIYERSLTKFFKSLINGNLEKTRFEVGYKGFIRQPDNIFSVKSIENNLFQISLKSNVIQTFNGKYLPSKIILKYQRDLSTIKFQKPLLRVDKYGNNIDIENVLLIGELSKSKVAEMLPINFSIYQQ